MANYFGAIGFGVLFGFFYFGSTSIEAAHNHADMPQAGNILQEHVEMNCSENTDYNQRCFGITKSECLNLLPDLYTRCDQEPANEFFDPARNESMNKFGECLERELLEHLETKRFEFDPQCK